MRSRDDQLEALHRDSVWFDLALAAVIVVTTLLLLALAAG